MTSLSKEGLKQRMEKLKQTAASQLAYVPPFQLVHSAEVLLSFVLHYNWVMQLSSSETQRRHFSFVQSFFLSFQPAEGEGSRSKFQH